MLNLTFWMNMPSFYQADLFRALTGIDGVDLKVVFENKIPEERAKLGWEDDLRGFEYEFIDSKNPVADALRSAHRHSSRINIVGGLWAGKIFEAVLAKLSISHSRYYIYSEAPDPREAAPGIKRRVLATLGAWIVRRGAGIFSISHFAADYYRSYGVEQSRIYPFGYFRAAPPFAKMKTTGAKENGVQIVFVGQLVHRKGVDILLSAIEPVLHDHNDLQLHLIGGGEKEEDYKKWVSEKNLSAKVIFDGVIEPRSVIDRISDSDLLVLPSRWDGWGIVVNEALMAGVPVVVSDMCGAADLIRDGVNGYVFHSEDVRELRSKLEMFMNPDVRKETLVEAALQTGRALYADNAARYLVEVFEGRAPREEDKKTFPWVAR